MESCPKASAAGDGVLQAEHLHLPVLSAATLLGDSNGCGLSEFFLDQYTEVDVSSEWLSSFVEDCLSSAGNCLPQSKDYQNLSTTTNPNTSITKPHNEEPVSSQNLTKAPIPGKPRSQRGRKANSSKTHKNPKFRWPDQSFQNAFSDPPLLEQAYWLADSELLAMPMKKEEESKEEICEDGDGDGDGDNKAHQQEQQQQARRCTHCQAQRTPQWRAGPMGPKTLCNACGMRYFKSGRLLPEYRPAKSPTFVSFKHSNSHKKVLQMRMGMVSSSTPVQQ